MTPLRACLRDRRHFALALILLALTMRLLLPIGFMPDVSAGRITIALCTGHGPATAEIALPSGTNHHDSGQTAKQDMPCPFASGAAHGLGGADPILLAIAIAFVMALGFVATPLPRRAEAAHLRPPSRGPPLTA